MARTSHELVTRSVSEEETDLLLADASGYDRWPPVKEHDDEHLAFDPSLFNGEGYELLGQQVAASISAALK